MVILFRNEDDLTMKVVEIAQLIAGLKKSSSSQQGAGINQLKVCLISVPYFYIMQLSTLKKNVSNYISFH